MMKQPGSRPPQSPSRVTPAYEKWFSQTRQPSPIIYQNYQSAVCNYLPNCYRGASIPSNAVSQPS
jgi:hypothetical protein